MFNGRVKVEVMARSPEKDRRRSDRLFNCSGIRVDQGEGVEVVGVAAMTTTHW